MAERNFKPSPQQQAIYDVVADPNGGNIIIDAVAGSGKTTTLIDAIQHMRGSVFLGAYNAAMAKELREKTKSNRNVKAGTFHSAGFSALKYAHGDKIGNPEPNKLRDLYDAKISKGPSDVYDSFAVSTCSMAKQVGIGVIREDQMANWQEMVEHYMLYDKLPDEHDSYQHEKEGIDRARRLLQFSNDAGSIIDFDDMIYIPLLHDLRMFKNNWVLIDEAQDTNATRRALAAKMLRRDGRLIAVGDPYQAIYGFSGADNNALELIKRDFDCQTYPLTVTYRCPKKVVRAAQAYVPHIRAHDASPDGSVVQVDYERVVEMAKPGDVILCRYNKYLVNLCFKFIKNDIPARIEGRAIGQGLLAIIGKWKVKQLDALVNRVQSWEKREIKKAEAKKNKTRIDVIQDQAECIYVIVERCMERGLTTVQELRQQITEMFADDLDKKGNNLVTLCSCHRSKGKEWDNVFLLGRFEMMGRESVQKWQTQQEQNLIYVALTRVMKILYDVTGVREEKKQHSFSEVV